MRERTDTGNTFIIPQEVLTDAVTQLPATSEVSVTTGDVTPGMPITSPQAEQDMSPNPHYAARKLLVGTAIAGALLFSGEQSANADTTHVAAGQESSQESGISLGNWLTIGVSGASAGIAGLALRSSNSHKREERFIEALSKAAGESDAARRQMQLNILTFYADVPAHAPKVHKSIVASLEARRTIIEKARKTIDNPEIESSIDEDTSEAQGSKLEQLDKIMTEERNADRTLVKLFVQTLPAAKEKLRKDMKVPIVRKLGQVVARSVGLTPKETKLEALRRRTQKLPAQNKGLVNASGINLDLLRDVLKDCDVSGTSFNGAGMQADNFTNVVFAGCSFQQAQLEGAYMDSCDLSGADFRAAYGSGDPEDPYFMGKTVFDGCLIDNSTQFGRLPNNHPNARHKSNNPDEPGAYRGGGTFTFKKLDSHTLSKDQIMALVHSWQRDGGLTLSADSDPEYIYRPNQSAAPTD